MFLFMNLIGKLKNVFRNGIWVDQTVVDRELEKLKKAAEIGVKVVSEDEFIGMFNVPTAGIPGSSEVKGLVKDPKQEKKLTSNALF